MTKAEPLADVLAEAGRLVALAEAEDVALRLLGGTAIQMRAGDRLAREFVRVPKDIDLVIPAGTGRELAELLTSSGYEPDEAFNLLEGARRMLFYDTANARQLDVFVSEFTMCHRIPLDERLLLEPVTIPLAELMLTKLQIVQLNPKDEIDVFAMLSAHAVGPADGDMINAERIAQLCARDWGLHRTVSINVEQLRGRVGEDIAAQLEAIETAIDAAPKSSRWRLRARVGERVRWYDEPDEVDAA
jgi:hypothetical protein